MIHAARYGEDRQPPAVATLPAAKNGWFSTSTPASCTHGLVVRSVQAGTLPSRPSLARIKRAGALRADELALGIELAAPT